MNELKTLFFAGAAAKAIGISPVTLRHYHARGICEFGHVVDGGEDNPRSRRRYDVREVCMMGMALTLTRFGFDMARAFDFVGNSQHIRDAIAAEFFGGETPDCILALIDSNSASEDEDADAWSDFEFVTHGKWKAGAGSAFEHKDPFQAGAAEVFLSVNLSAIARRVIAALRKGVED